MNSRILAYYKTLQFFQNNPFEESFCGLKRRDALTLVQTFIDQNVPPQEKGRINLLRSEDLLSSGRNFLNDAVAFGNQTKNAIDYLAEFSNKSIDETENPFSSSPNPKIQELVENYEKEVKNLSGESAFPGKRDAWRSALGRRGPFRKKWEEEVVETTTERNPYNPKTTEKVDHIAGEMITRELLKQRNIIAKKELADERLANTERFKKETGAVCQEVAETLGQMRQGILKTPESNIIQSANKEDFDRLSTVILDELDLSNVNADEEEKFWKDSSQNLLNPILGNNSPPLSPEQREQKIREAIVKKVQNKFSQDDPLAQNTELIRAATKAISPKYLIQRSYSKYFDKKLDEENAREGIGGLLFGKMYIEAERATQGIGGRRLSKKPQLLTDAVRDAYFEIHDKGLNAAEMSPQDFRKIFYAQIARKLRVSESEISQDQNLDFSPEIKHIATLTADMVIAGNAEHEIHAIPIPGLFFLDKLARTEIVANKDIFEYLKAGQTDKAFKYITEYDQTIDPKINKTGLRNYFLESATGGEHLSFEEKLVLKKYLDGYQQLIQKHSGVAWLARKSAEWHSLGDTKRFLWIPFLKIPKAQIWGYTRYFLQVSFSDPSIAPLAAVTLTWQLLKGSVTFKIRGRFTHLVDRAGHALGKTWLAKTPIIKEFKYLKSLFYVKGRGVPVITLLHPIEASKEMAKELGKFLTKKVFAKTTQWIGRFISKQAAEKFAAKFLVRALSGGIPVIGQILMALGFLWDFIFPEWLKKIIKAIVAGVAILIGWLIGLLIGVVGPLAAIGMVVGALVSILFGAPFFLAVFVGGVVGFVLQGAAWLLSGGQAMWLMPAWAHGFLSGVMQAGASLGQWIGGAIKGIASGLSQAVLPLSQLALVPVVAIGGTAITAAFSMTIIMTSVWTPLAPGAVPGGLVAQDFQVKKYVLSNPSNACQSKTIADDSGNHEVTTKCENDVTDSSKSVSFVYTVQIQVKDGVKISNIQMTDEITVVAQGPNITTPPTIFKHILQAPIDQAKVSAIVLPDPATGKNTAEIKYSMTFQDPKFQNSAVFNLVKVTASGQTASNGTAFTIGTPPPSGCPIAFGVFSCASLGSTRYPKSQYPNQCQHGENSYWPEASKCSYAIPWQNGTMGNSVSYTNATKCIDKTPLAADYGFAGDIVPGVSDEVVFPSILGEDISWTIDGNMTANTGGQKGWGFGAKYKGVGKNFDYQIYVTHLRESDFNKIGGQSGDKIGTICRHSRTDVYPDGECQLFTIDPKTGNTRDGAHVHIEVNQIDKSTNASTTLRPEDVLCRY